VAVALCGCSWGFLRGSDAPSPAQPEPEPLDTLAPTLEVRPAGGAYAAIQYVTLAADEPATVRYTLDGADPAGAGSAAAHVGASPVFWIRIAGGTTTLRAVAVDAAGNVSAPVSETYAVTLPAPDTTPPRLTLLAPPAGPVPLLGAPARWTSDEDVTWFAEVGGGGLPGFGAFASSGTAAAGEEVASAIPGHAFPGLSPATAWIHATDRVGLRSSLSFPAAPALPASGPVVGSAWCYDAVVAPDGRRAWFTAAGGVPALDVDPASATYETVVGLAGTPGGGPTAIGITPDGARLWVGVSSGVGLVAIATADGTLTPVTSTLPYIDRLAVSPVDARVWISRDGALYEVDASELQSVAVTALAAYDGPLSPRGLLAAAGGRRLVAGRRVIDVEPGSPTRGQALGAFAVTSYSGQVILSPDGVRAYHVTCPSDCTFSAHDVLTLAEVATHTVSASPNGSWWTLAATADHLLAFDAAGGVRIFRATDLVPLATVQLPLAGVTGVERVVVTPDGSRAYAVTYVNGATECQVVRVPLH
jgi:DNA-binding beta-propeller fold protein YncE